MKAKNHLINMGNDKKIKRIIALLEERGLEYECCHHSKLCGVDIDIYVPKYRIAVFDGHTQEKYEKVKRRNAPLFIREEETEEFVLEKMLNLLNVREKKLQWLQESKAKKEANRIFAEECERRHQEKLARREARMQECRKRDGMRPKRKRIVRYEKV